MHIAGMYDGAFHLGSAQQWSPHLLRPHLHIANVPSLSVML